MASWRAPGSILEAPGLDFGGSGDDFREIFARFGGIMFHDGNASTSDMNLYYLRVLGSPNPVQSFGRGLWGPQATEVRTGRPEVEWLKRQ